MSKSPILCCDVPHDAYCRICHGPETSDPLDPLLSPCLCKGSVRWVHRSCLQQWRSQAGWPASKACHCELCGFLYVYELQPQSYRELVVPVLRRGLYTACAIIVYASFVLMVTGSLHAGVGAAAALLGIWALSDASFSAYMVWHSLLGGKEKVGELARRDKTLGGAALNTLVISRAGRLQPSSLAESLAQARAVTEEEAAAQLRASGLNSRLELRDVESLDAGDEGDSQREAFSAGPDGAVIFCACCGGCCTLLLFSIVTPIAMVGGARLFGVLFADPFLFEVAATLAGLGALYFSAAAVLLTVMQRKPLPTVVRDDDGLPVVRSLTMQERTELRT
eukprot:TRINITY_DN27647_c0_g1_i1.p1 TRINITY_DN27647_c0_g1~~TRINITY_DN27647_c0_g1_i1.p1  ORF type:complete len:336 (+),score=64.14 TRINITY_DN27647_c0_g1_i1:71-1078(+)